MLKNFFELIEKILIFKPVYNEFVSDYEKSRAHRTDLIAYREVLRKHQKLENEAKHLKYVVTGEFNVLRTDTFSFFEYINWFGLTDDEYKIIRSRTLEPEYTFRREEDVSSFMRTYQEYVADLFARQDVRAIMFVHRQRDRMTEEREVRKKRKIRWMPIIQIRS